MTREGHSRYKSYLLQGESDIEQLAIVTRSLGSPSEEAWPGLRNLPDFDKISFPPAKGKSWKSLVPDPPPGAVDLIRALLTYNPANRLTVEQVIRISKRYRYLCYLSISIQVYSVLMTYPHHTIPIPHLPLHVCSFKISATYPYVLCPRYRLVLIV